MHSHIIHVLVVRCCSLVPVCDQWLFVVVYEFTKDITIREISREIQVQSHRGQRGGGRHFADSPIISTPVNLLLLVIFAHVNRHQPPTFFYAKEEQTTEQTTRPSARELQLPLKMPTQMPMKRARELQTPILLVLAFFSHGLCWFY